ncbi:MAG: FGGY family carbohydrate kinase [Phaeodactylibacter sp.]|uniref:xylulokinase n=1 Tax=Phaeodactylibacter sp. TaxID=1940289 RepID=UPI0032EB288B
MNQPHYSIGYDLGSSSVKAALIRLSNGSAVGRSAYPEQEMPIQAPQPGWAEQDPEFWWACIQKATQRLLEQTGVSGPEIGSIGIAYQMHGLVLVDEQHQVVRPSIIWCDSRAVATGQAGLEAIGQERALKHLLNSPGNFTASKLRWVQQQEPECYSRVRKMMLPGDYIAMRMSGGIQTTITGLSEGILWDFAERQVARDVLKAYEIDAALLPELVPTIGVQSELSEVAAKELGLAPGTPIAYRAGDQPNNALSLGVLKPGEVAATGGTSGVVYAVTDQPLFDPQSRVNGFAHVNYRPEAPHIGVLMCINGTGIQYSWLRKMLAPGTPYETLEAEAAKAPIGADGLTALPFGNGAERILNDRQVGAQMLGLDFNRHSQAHLLRAGLEGIAFSFIYGMQILRDMGLQMEVIRVGNDNLFQSAIFSHTVASLSGCTIEVMETTGAIGAAQAAAVGAGHWENLSDIHHNLKKVGQYLPQSSDNDAYQAAYSTWEKALQKTITP